MEHPAAETSLNKIILNMDCLLPLTPNRFGMKLIRLTVTDSNEATCRARSELKMEDQHLLQKSTSYSHYLGIMACPHTMPFQKLTEK